MRQTHAYGSSDYAGENASCLGWICTCCFRSGSRTTVEEEIEESARRHRAKEGVIIGRVAGREAYLGNSGMIYEQQQPSLAGQLPLTREALGQH